MLLVKCLVMYLIACENVDWLIDYWDRQFLLSETSQLQKHKYNYTNYNKYPKLIVNELIMNHDSGS